MRWLKGRPGKVRLEFDGILPETVGHAIKRLDEENCGGGLCVFELVAGGRRR